MQDSLLSRDASVCACLCGRVCAKGISVCVCVCNGNTRPLCVALRGTPANCRAYFESDSHLVSVHKCLQAGCSRFSFSIYSSTGLSVDTRRFGVCVCVCLGMCVCVWNVKTPLLCIKLVGRCKAIQDPLYKTRKYVRRLECV